jgi:hypothetical protein
MIGVVRAIGKHGERRASATANISRHSFKESMT